MSKLRLILGVGRSGTTWLSSVLALATQPMRFFPEPLYHLRPKICLRFTRDITATTPEPPRRFYAAFQFLCAPRANWKAVIRRPLPKRDDPDFAMCLVKEVHSLLGAKALIETFRTPAIALLRDPLYIVDSLFNANQLPSSYLYHEERLVRIPAFLEAHLPSLAERVASIVAELKSRPFRLRTILEKVLTVELMENWFHAWSSRQPLLKLMKYEDFCTDPLSQFQIAADFLGIQCDASLAAAVVATTSANATSGHRHSIHRDSAAQLNHPWRFLTASEVAEGHKLIDHLRA